MKEYEIMCVFEPQVESYNSGLAEVKEKFQGLDIKITKEDDMGVKELSYEMKSHTHAHYMCLNVSADPQNAKKINDSCKLIKSLLRILVISKK